MTSSSQIPALVLSVGTAVGSTPAAMGTGGTAQGRQLPLGLQRMALPALEAGSSQQDSRGYSLCEKRWVMGVPG